MMSAETLLHEGSIGLAAAVTLAALSIIVRTLRNGVAPMPASGSVRTAIMALLRQLDLPDAATVVELGSGWGSLGLALSRAMPAAAVIGYENSPIPFWFSLLARGLARAHNLRLVYRNFHTVSLRDADLVVGYLSPDAMARLQPKFAAQLKPSAVVVSSTFALPAWRASRVVVANDMYRTRIYLYHAGLCRSGTPVRHIDILAPLSGGDDSRADSPQRSKR